MRRVLKGGCGIVFRKPVFGSRRAAYSLACAGGIDTTWTRLVVAACAGNLYSENALRAGF